MVSLAQIGFDVPKLEFTASVSVWLSLVLIAAVAVAALARVGSWRSYRSLVLDAAEIGIGSGKITLKPNLADRQVAYAIWVELSTRKIGLPIDVAHDVIIEVYHSWYEFFSVTRDLLKSVPVAKVRQRDTKKIIDISMSVLNDCLRPHLTSWQARFRHWYEAQLKRSETDDEPQKIQKNFPGFEELTTDMLAVNEKLIAYRRAMEAIVFDA